MKNLRRINRKAMTRVAAVSLTAALSATLFFLPPGDAALPSSLEWKMAGWTGGGAYPMTVADPNVAGRFYLLSDIGGLWRSDDRGDRWQYRTEGLTNINTAVLAVAHSDSNILYLGTEAGVFRSTDAGARWNFLSSTGTARSFHRPESYRAIAVDRLDPNKVFIGTRSGEVFSSGDGGASWTRVGTVTYPFGGPGAVSTLYLSRDSNTLYAGASGGLRKCDLASGAWTNISTSGPVTDITGYKLNETVYFTQGKKIAWTADQGATVQFSNDIPVNGVVYRFAVTSGAGGNIKFLVGWREGWNGGALLSEDEGKSWTNVERNLAHDVQSDPTRVWTQGFGWPLSVSFDPDNAEAMFFTDFWGVWRSDDNGQSWFEKIRGAPNAVGSDIVVAADGSLLVGSMDNGLMRSLDEGATYVNLVPNASLNGNNINGDMWRVVTSGSRIIATNSPWNLSRSQILVSNNNGASFSVTSAGLPQNYPTGNTVWDKGYPRALALDPQNPSRVYLGIDGDSGGGLFISDDGGSTWTRSSGQPASLSIYNGLAVDPVDPNRIYWAAIGSNGGVYRSQDAGKTWSRVMSAATWVFDLAVDKDGRVYAAADAGGPALYRSIDGGSSWSLLKKFPPTSGPCEAIAIDPNDPKRIAVSTIYWGGRVPGRIWFTEDGGLNWTDITGNMPNGAGAAAMAFSRDGAKLFASRYAGATYRLQLVQDSSAPSAPTNLSAAVAGTTVDLSWTASTDDVAVKGYKVFRDGAEIGTTPTTNYSDTTVSAGKDYSYTVTAFDAANNSSPVSAALAVNVPLPPDTAAPTSPSNLASSFSSANQVDLSWTASVDDRGVTGYKIYREGAQIGTSTTASYMDISVIPGSSYAYTVAAFDAAGNVSIQSEPLEVRVPQPPDTTPPSAPSNLMAALSGTNQVDLSWSASSDNIGILHYTVFSGATSVGTTSATLYTHANPQPGTSYVYTVQASDAAGNVSSSSNAASVSVPGVSSAPQNLTATVGTDRITLRWLAPPAGSFAVYGYNVRRNGAYLKSVTTLSASDTAVTRGSTYTYAIQAYTSANRLSELSNAVTVTFGQADTTPPSAPMGLAAALSSTGAVNLSWAPSTDNVGIGGYEVFRNDVSLGRMTSLTYSDAGAAKGATHSYHVKAFDAAGNVSSPSNLVSITVPQVSSAPRNLTGSATSTGINLSWQAPLAGSFAPAGYDVVRDGQSLKKVLTLSTSDNTVAAGTTHTYVVRAYDPSGALSDPSNTVTVTFGRAAPSSAPQNLSATIGTDRITFRWQAPPTGTFNVAGYNIRRNGAYLKSTSTLSGWDIPAIGSTNTYVVYAYNASATQSDPSNAVRVTYIPMPVVRSASVSGVTTSTATISWSTNTPASGYVKYGTTATNLSSVSYTVPAGGTSAAVLLNSLQRNTVYYYQVVAFNATGSATSATAQFRTAT